MRQIRPALLAALSLIVLLAELPALSTSRVTKSKVLTGFTLEVARPVDKSQIKGKEDVEKLEAALDESLAKTVPAAQAMFEQFRSGKHPFRGLEFVLDLMPPPEEPKVEPPPREEPKKDDKAKGRKDKAKDVKKADAKKRDDPKKKDDKDKAEAARKKEPEKSKKAVKPREVALAFQDVDREGQEALAKAGVDLAFLRLHTVRYLSNELATRVTASFLLAQAFGGPLKDLPPATGFEQGAPAALVCTLDRVSPATFVTAWRLRDHLRAIAAGKEAPAKDSKTSEAELKRAQIVAIVWACAFDDKPYPDDLYEKLDRLGNADATNLLDLMAQACRESRFADFWGAVLAKLNTSADFAASLKVLKDYVTGAYDYPLPENLLNAVQEGDAPRVGRLLHLTADPNSKDADGEPALILAINQERTEIARLLVEAGADPKIVGHDRRSALELATWKRQTDLVKLLTTSAELREKGKPAGTSALLQAVKDGDLSALKTALGAGASGDGKDEEGTPALVLAARSAKAAELVPLLAGSASQLDAADKDGFTALMVAADHGTLEAIKSLLAHGASREAKNAQGATAADLAEKAGRSEALALLRK
jgi:ankyrin repeat protein